MTTTSTDRTGRIGDVAFKAPCLAASTAALTLSGEQTIDSVACVTGDRVLVKNQASNVDNGIYVVDTGAWSRSTDCDGSYDMARGTQLYVISGSVNANTFWRVSSTGGNVPGTDSITFAASVLTDSSTMSFLQAGSGAISRTIQAKARDVVALDDFMVSTTDKTAAFTAALACPSLAYGGILWLGRGTHQVTNLGTIPDGVELRGESPYVTVIQTTQSGGTVITMDHSTSLRDLKITSSVTRTTGYLVDVIGNSVHMENVEFDTYYIAVTCGTIGGIQPVACLIDNCKFRLPCVSTGSGAIQALNFSNFQVRNTVITGPALSATQPDFGLRFQNGDTAFVTDCNITLHGKALVVDTPASNNCFALTIDSCAFDSAGAITTAAAVSSAEFIPAGGVYDTKIANTWFGLSQGASGCIIQPTGAGAVDGITFTGCEFVDNGDNGLTVDGAATINWFVTGGFSAGNTNYGIKATNTSKFVIVGHRAGPAANRGVNNYGIVVVAGTSDEYVIAHNDVTGNTTAGIFDAGTGTNKIIQENLGYLPRPPGRISNIPIGAVAYNALGTSAVHVAGTTYYSEIWLPAGKTITGIGVLNGATVGTNNLAVAIHGAEGGAALATSALAGVLSAGANAFQEIALTAPFTAPCAGLYWIAVQCNGTTATTRRIAASTYLNLTKSTAGTFGTFPSLTVPTTFTADVGPIAYVY